jgi:DNA-directed RNA polymerase beta' subunit
VPQSVTTEQEIAALAGVKTQILTRARTDHQVVVQDVALGTYLITQDKVESTKMIQPHGPLSTSDGVPPALKDGETSYTGQQAFSQILPATLHVDVGETKIVSGELVAGQVTKLYQMQTTGILQRVQRRQHGGRTHAGQHRTWRATG